MADLLIRDIEGPLEQRLGERARSHRRILSKEARLLLKKALLEPPDKRKMGTALLELFPEEFRGDDLIFEIPGDVSRPTGTES